MTVGLGQLTLGQCASLLYLLAKQVEGSDCHGFVALSSYRSLAESVVVRATFITVQKKFSPKIGLNGDQVVSG